MRSLRSDVTCTEAVVTDHLVGNAVPCEVSLRLLDDRNGIGIVELVYFQEVAVVVNDNQIACITDAEQISADLSPGSVRDIMRHQCLSLLTGLMTAAYRTCRYVLFEISIHVRPEQTIPRSA